MDLSHLNALEHRLHDERQRLAAAKTDAERHLRGVWIAQLEREIAGERSFLGLTAPVPLDMTDDELLAHLER